MVSIQQINHRDLNFPSFGSQALQNSLNMMGFFLAFPSVYVLGNSLYFYVFLLLLMRTRKITGTFFRKHWVNFFIMLLFISGLISSIFHPYLQFDAGGVFKINMIIHFAYWFAIGAYFVSWSDHINLFQLSKWITLGFLCQTFAFYFLQFNVNFVVLRIVTNFQRNSYVFNTICFSGFFLYYLFIKYGKKGALAGMGITFFALLLTNGRAGAAIALILFLLLATILYSSIRSFSRLTVVVVFVFLIFSGFSQSRLYSYGKLIAPYVEVINPRFAELISGEGVWGDLSFDKSWLLRRLMIEKAQEIVTQYPFLGVGWGNFTKFGADLNALNDFRRLAGSGHDKAYFNTRSAHNSYAQFVGETGLVGFSFLLCILGVMLFQILGKIWTGNLTPPFIISISFIGMLIHSYSVSSITGANFWFITGVATMLLGLRRNTTIHS